MHALVLLCINPYTKFEVSSFTNYKYMIGAKFKKLVSWLWPWPFTGGFVVLILGLNIAYMHAEFDHFSFSYSGDMVGNLVPTKI